MNSLLTLVSVPRVSRTGRRVIAGLASFVLLGLLAPLAIAQPPTGGAASGETSAILADVETAEGPLAKPGDAVDRPFGRRETLLASVTIFVLAIFVGFEVITKVPPTLHTPLMSGSNAISGITVVGAFMAAGSDRVNLASFVGLCAVTLATINVVGGFLVTHRMLAMFKRK